MFHLFILKLIVKLIACTINTMSNLTKPICSYNAAKQTFFTFFRTCNAVRIISVKNRSLMDSFENFKQNWPRWSYFYNMSYYPYSHSYAANTSSCRPPPRGTPNYGISWQCKIVKPLFCIIIAILLCNNQKTILQTFTPLQKLLYQIY